MLIVRCSQTVPVIWGNIKFLTLITKNKFNQNKSCVKVLRTPKEIRITRTRISSQDYEDASLSTLPVPTCHIDSSRCNAKYDVITKQTF